MTLVTFFAKVYLPSCINLGVEPIHGRGQRTSMGGRGLRTSQLPPLDEGISVYSVAVTSPRGNFCIKDRPSRVTDLKT